MIFISLLYSSSLHAQTGISMSDTTFTGNFLETNLFNDINLANLKSALNYSNRFGRYNIELSNFYLSNVSKLGQNFFRDYNNFRMIVDYSILNNFRAGVGFQNMFLSDDKNVETNKNNSSYYFSDFNYDMCRNVFLNAKLGIKTEDQIGEYNSGLSGVFTAQSVNLITDEYLTNGKLILFYEDLIEKKNHNYELGVNVFKRFTANTDNTGYIKAYNLRNDFYFPASQSISDLYNVKNNIEKRTENFISVGDVLNYNFSENILFSLSGFYTNRQVTKQFKYKPTPENILFENTYDTKMLEDKIELSGNLNYFLTGINTQLKFLYSERTENHNLINTEGLNPLQIAQLENAEKNKNNNSSRTALILDLLYDMSNTNSFGVSGLTSLLKYDTDFDENYDDRDEIESILSAVHRYDNRFNFNVQTRFDLIISKLSYIFSQRSANNYKNRIYKLTSESSFRPTDNLISKNVFQVLANYTVYDFEDIVSQVQSFSYRQLYVRDSTSYDFTDNFTFDFIGELKFYEQGQFNNREFTVKPIAYYEEFFLRPDFFYNINDYLNAGIGYKYFRQNRYQYESAQKNLINVFETFGPVGEINFYFNNNSIVKLTGGFDFIKYSNPPQEDSAVQLNFNIIWNM